MSSPCLCIDVASQVCIYQTCPTGWLHVPSTGYCYLVAGTQSERRSMCDAAVECESISNGSALLTLDSYAEWMALSTSSEFRDLVRLANTSTVRYWFGLRSAQPCGHQDNFHGFNICPQGFSVHHYGWAIDTKLNCSFKPSVLISNWTETNFNQQWLTFTTPHEPGLFREPSGDGTCHELIYEEQTGLRFNDVPCWPLYTGAYICKKGLESFCNLCVLKVLLLKLALALIAPVLLM